MKRILVAFVLFCATAALCQNTKTVFLVRHAEKVSEAKDAQLSDIGEARAACLEGVLADADIRHVIASDVLRTQQTAQPLADHMKIKIDQLPAAEIDRFAKEIRNAQGNTLVVAHSDTLPKIIQSVTGKTVTIGSNDYDLMFIVSFGPNPSSPVVLHYCSQSKRQGESPQTMR